jgi:hypothetical protein
VSDYYTTCENCGEGMGVGEFITCDDCRASATRKVYQVYHRDCGPSSRIELFETENKDRRIEHRCSGCSATWHLSGMFPGGCLTLDPRSGLTSLRHGYPDERKGD